MGARRILWQIFMGQSAIAAQTGLSAEAADLRRQAQAILGGIAAHTPERLRPMFLALPHVRTAMEG